MTTPPPSPITKLHLPHGYASLDAIDQAYNPRLRAVNLEAELRGCLHRSEAARRELPYRAGIRYGPTLAETLDIVPGPNAGAPVFLYIHSGYWRANAARDFTHVARGPYAMGYTTVLVDHALCPAVTLDEIVRQVRAAAIWVIRHIADYGGNPSRIVVGGHSAGGHLGAMLLCTPWEEQYGLLPDPFIGALLVSGLFDIAPLRYSYLQPAIQLDDGLVQRNSPIRHVRTSRTPVTLSWGGLEQSSFEDQSMQMHGAWNGLNRNAELLPQPDADHFTAIHGFEQPDSALCGVLRGMVNAAKP